MIQSEVAQLRQHIELQLEAMQRGLQGFAMGAARHAFIVARMERIAVYQDRLAEQVGESAATQIVCSLYAEVMEDDQASGRPLTASS
jgi:uncharacterized protein YjiK